MVASPGVDPPLPTHRSIEDWFFSELPVRPHQLADFRVLVITGTL